MPCGPLWPLDELERLVRRPGAVDRVQGVDADADIGRQVELHAHVGEVAPWRERVGGARLGNELEARPL